MNKLIPIIIGVLILGAVGGFISVKFYPSTVTKYGDISSLSGGLRLLLANIGDVFSLGDPNVGTLDETVKAGTYADATTTIFAVKNPLLATSSVEAHLKGQNGTGTIAILIATSSTPFAPATMAPILANQPSSIYIDALGTSTQFTVNSISGDKSNSIYTYRNTGATLPATSSSMIIGPNDYIIGVATGTLMADTVWAASTTQSVINPVNTFSGSYLLNFFKF